MSPKDVTHSDDVPHDRLTSFANEVLDIATAHPGYEPGMQLMVFVNNTERAGIGIRGYEDTKDAIVHLFVHLQAMFQSMGKDLQILPFPPNDPGSS